MGCGHELWEGGGIGHWALGIGHGHGHGHGQIAQQPPRPFSENAGRRPMRPVPPTDPDPTDPDRPIPTRFDRFDRRPIPPRRQNPIKASPMPRVPAGKSAHKPRYSNHLWHLPILSSELWNLGCVD